MMEEIAKFGNKNMKLVIVDLRTTHIYLYFVTDVGKSSRSQVKILEPTKQLYV
jgi:hypothetical protein